MSYCQHLRQRLSDGEVVDPFRADTLLPCAHPDCEAGVPGHKLVTPNEDNSETTWRRVPNRRLGWLWARVTGTAKIGGVE